MINGKRCYSKCVTRMTSFHFHFQPPRIVSPDTLLKRRLGNSFEMATLLCSLLIGNRYGAMVVSGYASREVTQNDQKRVICPNIPIRSSKQPVKVRETCFCANYISLFCNFNHFFLERRQTA